MGRLDPFPSAEDLSHIFGDAYFVGGGERGGYQDYEADAPCHRVNARSRLARLPARARSIASDGRLPGAPGDGDHSAGVLVDVGCASGHTLEAARQMGYCAVGVEVAPHVRDLARAKGFRVEPSLIDLVEGDPARSLAGRVDVVCFFQVLEHLPDPAAALAAARRLLRPGGTLLCETWDGRARVARLSGDRWQQLSPPAVLWVFDRATIGMLLARAGLRLERWRPSTKLVSVGLVADQLAPRLPGPAGAAVMTLGRRAARRRLRYGLGDLVLFTAVHSQGDLGSAPVRPQTPG